MKKIAINVYSLSRGGAERVSINLSKYMVENNYECLLLTDCVENNEYSVPNGVKRLSIDVHGNKYIHYLTNILKLRKILKIEKPDVFLIMDLSSCLLTIPAAFGLNIKIVVSERNDPLHFPGKNIVKKISRWLMKFADGYVFQTKEAKQFYKKITKDRGIVISNPLYIEDLPLPYDGSREKTIVNVGRLSEQKNQKLLIDSFSRISAKYSDYKLVIYGEGKLKEELIEYSKKMKVNKQVIFAGNRTDVLDKIKKSSLFVMSSDFEGMPNALLEAMAIGLPCISTDCPCGGPRAVIQSDKNGILVPINNADELSSAIDYLLSNKEKLKSIGNEAIKIREKLDSKIICKKWIDYLSSI